MGAFVKDALLKPAPEKPIQYETISFSATALFDFDKAVLKPEGKAELRELGEYIKGKGVQVVDIDVVGHTDSIGTEAYNQKLSERRANAVKDFLTGEGVDGSIIEVGQLLGTVGSAEVRSSFAGEIKGVLAYDGERVTSRQPIAWLRTTA